jgi:hypothetical protein
VSARAHRRVAPVLTLALTFALGSCLDDFFVDPAPPAGAGLGVRLSGALAASQADAFDRADVLEIALIDDAGTPLLARELPFESTGADTRVSIDLELAEDEVTFRLLVALRAGAAPLFVGESDVTLRPGETTEASVTLAPVAAELLVPASLPAFTAYGESRPVQAYVLMATGDTIEGAQVSWSSRETGIVAVQPAGASSALATAVADGATELVASHAPGTPRAPAVLQAQVAVEVAAEVDRVDVDPSDLDLEVEETAALEATPRDRNGNVVPGRAVVWSTSDPDVVEVDQQGVVAAVGPGTARVRAEVDGAVGFADVRVDAPEPPPTPTGVSVRYANGVRLSWVDRSGGTAGYRVERAVTPPPPSGAPTSGQPRVVADAAVQGAFVEIATLPAGTTSFVDPAPVPGLLEYRLRACNPFACSAPSASAAFAYQMPPSVFTEPPRSIGSSTAELRGQVNPNGLTTFVYFEVDTSPTFSEPFVIPPDGAPVGGGFDVRAVGIVAENLPFGTTLYCRLIGLNDAGVTVGNVVAFTTGPGQLLR